MEYRQFKDTIARRSQISPRVYEQTIFPKDARHQSRTHRLGDHHSGNNILDDFDSGVNRHGTSHTKGKWNESKPYGGTIDPKTTGWSKAKASLLKPRPYEGSIETKLKDRSNPNQRLNESHDEKLRNSGPSSIPEYKLRHDYYSIGSRRGVRHRSEHPVTPKSHVIPVYTDRQTRTADTRKVRAPPSERPAKTRKEREPPTERPNANYKSIFPADDFPSRHEEDATPQIWQVVPPAPSTVYALPQTHSVTVPAHVPVPLAQPVPSRYPLIPVNVAPPPLTDPSYGEWGPEEMEYEWELTRFSTTKIPRYTAVGTILREGPASRNTVDLY